MYPGYLKNIEAVEWVASLKKPSLFSKELHHDEIKNIWFKNHVCVYF